MQTLRHVVATLEYVKSKNVEVRFHGRGKNEASHYCGQCEVSKILQIGFNCSFIFCFGSFFFFEIMSKSYMSVKCH